MSILNNFKLNNEKESYLTVIENIDKGVIFKGTNLWILVFAIFIASLGLNVNSTAVIIGAMLVSPLMGPIMGIGMGIAINDTNLLRRAFYNYFFAAGVGLLTSTIYFFLSPINEAHSEILARTAPNIYDVLIALFGGFAGILATSSKQKGNVIPGVAIATALMPPLCTAGYGLATWQLNFFFGAFYLFLINSVFIALATLITARFLKFPFAVWPDKKHEIRSKRIIWVVVIITLIPSLYFGYDIVQRNKFEKNANRFIEIEAVFPNDYLLLKNIDAKKKTISLTFGGEYIEKDKIELLKTKLKNYELQEATLEIRQGFAYLQDDESDDKTNKLTLALNDKELQIQALKKKIDSMDTQNRLGTKIFKELKAQHPEITSSALQWAYKNSDSSDQLIWISIINSNGKLNGEDKDRIQKWLSVRLNTKDLTIHFDN